MAAESEGREASPLRVLIFKRDSNFTDLTSGAAIDVANHSRFRPRTESRARLGLGFVDAIAAALQERIKAVAYNDDVSLGRVTVLGRREDSHLLSFTAAADTITFGGFVHSKGGATYQVAMIALAYCLARRRNAPVSDPAGEVAVRWWSLVRQMDALYPRSRPGLGWGSAEVKAVFNTPAGRTMVEQLADSLEWAIRLNHSAFVPREVVVRAAPVVEFDEALPLTMSAADLLTAPTSTAPEPAPEPGTVGAHATRTSEPTTAPSSGPGGPAPLISSPAPLVPTAPVTAAPAPATAPAAAVAARTSTRVKRATSSPELSTPEPLPAPRIFGPYVDRVQRALRREGARLMLVGPTATGKTFQAVQCLLLMGWRVESVVLDPGKDAQELVGGFTRRAKKPASAEKDGPESWGQVWKQAVAWELPESPEVSGSHQQVLNVAQSVIHALRAIVRVLYLLLLTLAASLRQERQDWEPIDGPVARWARSAAAGTPTALILDELARGHQSCVSFVMGILNVYTRAEVEQQGLQVPGGSESCPRFHIIDLWHTRERLVVPVTMVKIVATANLGDKYVGVDLADPAFRRRWDAWLHLGDYAADVQRDILADKLGLPKGSALVAALARVAAGVAGYQQKEEKLNATLDLATLINWGCTVQTYLGAGSKVGAAFETAAADTWLERVAPLKGADIDPDVRTALTRLVKEHTPAAV
jgi:hypothetical protein